MNTIKLGRNLGLDIVRAIAICLVLIVHLITNIFQYDISIFWFLAYLGVELFFNLSGFLIGNIIIDSIDFKTGKLSWGNFKFFFIRRWFRTVPLYYFILLSNFFVAFFILKSVHSFDVRYVFWLQNLCSYPPSFFGESWSLSIEEWFYLAYPFGLFFYLNLLNHRVNLKLLSYTILYIATGVILRTAYSENTYQEFNIVLFRMDAIAYGVLFAILNRFYFNRLVEQKFILLGFLGVIIIFIGSYLFIYEIELRSLYYPIIAIGINFSILFMKECKFSWFHSRVKMIVVYISKISYSLYLNNLIIIFLIRHYLQINPFIQFLLSIIFIFAFSHFTYKVIEVTFLKGRERFFPVARQFSHLQKS